MRTVKPYDKNGHLCEIYSTGFQLAFASPDLEQCHDWVLCKDFLTDVVWAQLNQSSASIYGFRYQYKNNPVISIDPVLMLARNKQVKNGIFDKCIVNSTKFMNMLETKLKFTLCKSEKVEFKIEESSYSVWMFTLDPRWLHAPPMVSLLSLMMRVGCHYNGSGYLASALRKFKKSVIARRDGLTKDSDNELEKIEDFKALYNDANYLRKSYALRTLIIQKGISIFKPEMKDNYPSNVDIHTIHNNWGIVEARNCEQLKTLWDFSGLEIIKAIAKEKAIKKEAVQKVSK